MWQESSARRLAEATGMVFPQLWVARVLTVWRSTPLGMSISPIRSIIAFVALIRLPERFRPSQEREQVDSLETGGRAKVRCSRVLWVWRSTRVVIYTLPIPGTIAYAALMRRPE